MPLPPPPPAARSRSRPAEDANEATEGDPVHAVVDPAVPDRERAWREAERELEDAHPKQPSGEVVTELVHGDDRGEHHDEERDRERRLLEELDEPAHQATTGSFSSARRTAASIA